ncbi:MAG TPA: hypothetical protein VN253_17345, partial [Kofleriaceae bacterium]|nr:hypothetical protein [Kofleriaceae bacterium]
AAAARDSSPSMAAPEVRVAVPGASNAFLAAAFGVGVVFVVLPVLVYLAKAPDHGRFVGTCEGLAKPDDTYGIMVRVDRATGGAPSIEILDPLCPACAAFEKRLTTSGYHDKLERKAVLFPLDNTCNWMVTEATHPGACTVSEAVLCAGDRAPDVLAWAFEEGERIRAAAKQDPAAAARIVRERFPDLASCVGSPEAKSRLNKSLRWAVANNLRVLTPQLYIANVKLCDEDVDLGLEYSLRVMLERYEAKTLARVPAEAPPPATPAPSPVPSGDKPHKADAPASKPASDKPSKPAPDKVDKADKADKADKPAEPPTTPTDKPITSPSEAPAGGTP